MPKEKTNSITHLVKIVAEEVLEEKLLKRRNMDVEAFNQLYKRVEKLEETLSYQSLHYLDDIKTNLNKAGRPWTDEEDLILIDEAKCSIAIIAKNHNRSKGAIKARMEQKGILEI